MLQGYTCVARAGCARAGWRVQAVTETRTFAADAHGALVPRGSARVLGHRMEAVAGCWGYERARGGAAVNAPDVCAHEALAPIAPGDGGVDYEGSSDGEEEE